MSDQELSVSQEIILPFPVEAVWDFLMSEEKMRSWFNADKFEIELNNGGIIEMPFPAGGRGCHVIGEVTILTRYEKYVFVWWERDLFGEEWFNCTRVTITLEKLNNGRETRLKLVHDEFKNLPIAIQEETHQRYMQYWRKSGIMKRLETLLKNSITQRKQ